MKKRNFKILAPILAVSMLFTSFGAATVNAKEKTTQPSIITEATLQEGTGWQESVTFPKKSVDDTLAMNSMCSFETYKGQGLLYLTPSEGTESFKLFVNNAEIDTKAITSGKSWQVDISAYTVNGTNTIQVSNIKPAGSTVDVKIPYPVIVNGTPESVGIDPAVFDVISDIVQSDVDNGFPGAQMAVIKDGQLIYQNSWGTVNAYNPDGTPNTTSAAVTNDTLYDLASNTKMYSVNYALQYLVSEGYVNLDTKIVDLVGSDFVTKTIDITYDGYTNPGLEQNKAWKSELTIRDILRHQAGFPADPQYHNDAFNQQTQKAEQGVVNVLFSGNDGSEATRKLTLEAICKTPLMYEPGTKTVYSDVDYMLLGFIIESITGRDLDVFLDEIFWTPMGLDSLTYNPLLHGVAAEDCAATELNGNTRDGAISFTGVRTNTVQGQVHDEKAYYAMAGVSGHAGMFGTATDVAKLASIMLTGGYGGNKYFTQNVMDMFTAPKHESTANWGLGWWREGDMQRAWYFGTQSPSNTIGHQGWTGTLTMVDPEERLVVVYLTNKINSPVTDKAANANKFNGNWYTASTLGFVAQILYQGIDSRTTDCDAAMAALLPEMASYKFELVKKQSGITAEHPIVKAAYSIIDVVFDRAQESGSAADWAYAQDVYGLLDPSRDAAKMAELSKLFPTN